MTLLTRILEFVRRERALTGIIAAILISPLIFFAAVAPVKTGTKTVCKYKHTIQDDTGTKWVVRWTAGSYKVTVKKTTCEKHKYLETLWAKEQAAKKKGDYKKAESILNTIRVADPLFPGLLEEIAEVSELAGESPPAGTPGGDQPGSTDNPPSDGDQPPGYSGDLTVLFPSSLAGYQQISSSTSGLNASRLYSSDQAVHPRVSMLTIQLDQTGSESDADTFVNKEIKNYYAADPRSASVNGLTAYFGTDNQRLAVLAYKLGGIVFTLEMQTAGGAPKDLYDEIVELAKNIP